jgi:hypothetical protein
MLRQITAGVAAGFLAVAALAATVAPGSASTFFGWRVADVPKWDTLNVRAWPSSGSKILAAYPNGTSLSMTGKCTGGVHFDDISGWPKWKQREAVRTVWCETWIDPTGNGQFRTAWVYGRYIAPL